MSQWFPISTISELSPGAAKECVVEGRIVALFQTSEGYFAVDGICAHAGGPVADGALDGCIVTCPWHGWQYDVMTGAHCLNEQIRLESFSVKVEGESILVELP